MTTTYTLYGHSRRKWNDLVSKAVSLSAREDEVRWDWADLLLLVAPVDLHALGAPKGVKQSDRIGLQPTLKEVLQAFKLASGSELTVATMTEHRLVAINWPKGKRVKGASWSAHRALVGVNGRFELLEPGMTFKEASLLAGKDLTHLARKSHAKRGASYESALEHIKWANRLLRLAHAEINVVTIDYKERNRIKTVLISTQTAVDGCKAATRSARSLQASKSGRAA